MDAIDQERADLNALIEHELALSAPDMSKVASLAARMEQLLGGDGQLSLSLLAPLTVDSLCFHQLPSSNADALGLNAWPGSLALAALIASRPALVAGLSLVELGCGPAVAGCVAARRGAARVVLTDLSDVLPLARANAARNGLAVDCVEYRWGEPFPGGETFDVVLAAELVARIYDGEALIASLRALAPVTLLSFQRHDEQSAQRFLTSAARYFDIHKFALDPAFRSVEICRLTRL